MSLYISELENFVNNKIWQAIVQMTIDRTNTAVDTILTTDPVQEPAKIATLQGYIKALAEVVDFPAILKEQVEYEEKEKNREENK